MKATDPKREQRKVDAWNAVHQVGTEVSVLLDNGSKLRTKTIAPASLLGGHTAVAWLENMRGCFRLDSCTATRGS